MTLQSTDFAWVGHATLARMNDLNGVFWVGQPLPRPGGVVVWPFILRDGELFQPRLLLPDGQVRVFTSLPAESDAFLFLMNECDELQWPPLALSDAVPQPAAAVDPLYIGPAVAFPDAEDRRVVYPMVVQEEYGYRVTMLIRHAPRDDGDYIACGSVIYDARAAMDAALVMGFLWPFSSSDESANEHQAKQLALLHVQELGRWAAALDEVWPRACQRALQAKQEVLAINRAFFKDDALEAAIRAPARSDKERLQAAAERAGALAQRISIPAARKVLQRQLEEVIAW